MIIISLSGKKQSGKTTVATILKSELEKTNPDIPVYILSWADALKEEVCKACGVSLEFLEKNKPNFRLILQGWGTEFRRDLCNPDYWVERLFQKLVKFPDKCFIIIPDTRFKNEYDKLKYVGARLYKVVRETYLEDIHSSETELDEIKEWDLLIRNETSVEDLTNFIKLVVKEFYTYDTSVKA